MFSFDDEKLCVNQDYDVFDYRLCSILPRDKEIKWLKINGRKMKKEFDKNNCLSTNQSQYNSHESQIQTAQAV